MSKWLKDTIERVAVTFIEAFIATIGLTAVSDWDLSTARAAAFAGVAAALAVVKAAIAARVTSDVSPASLAPASREGPQGGG